MIQSKDCLKKAVLFLILSFVFGWCKTRISLITIIIFIFTDYGPCRAMKLTSGSYFK